MISKQDILKMAKKLGMDISEAYDSESEESIEIPEVIVMTPDGKRKLEKEKYEEGKTTGVEMSVKEIKQAKGLDFKGKGIEDLVAHLETKAGDDGRLKKLQDNLTAAEQRALAAEQRAESIEIETETLGAIPAEYAGLNKRELKALAAANGLELRKEDNKLVPYRNGQRVRDERTQEDIDPTVAYKSFFEVEKKMTVAGTPLVDPKKGRGGGDEPPKGGKVTTKRSEIEKAWRESNPDKNIMGQEYASHFASKMKEIKESGQTVEMD